MTFPFTDLPIELALDIITIAACPDSTPSNDLTCTRPLHTTALTLASVSRSMYRYTMPHLLHTVACCKTDQLKLFIRSFHDQRCRLPGSALALDYPKLVRRFWATGIWESLVNNDNDIDYRALYDIIRGVDCLGISFHSLHLIYNALECAHRDPTASRWDCHRLILCGSHWRWSPLSSTAEGVAFLKHITHLALWVPHHDGTGVAKRTKITPCWATGIPFSLMPSLCQFSFPLLSSGSYNGMMVYSGTRELCMEWMSTGQFGGETKQIMFQRTSALAGENSSIWDFDYMQEEIERCQKLCDR